VVKSGQYVKKGELIGYTGNSGISNGHIYIMKYDLFSVRKSLLVIKWTQENYNQIFEKEKKVPWQRHRSYEPIQLVKNRRSLMHKQYTQ